MKLFVSKEVMEVFQIETQQFGIEEICLVPGWAEGEEPKVWAMLDARTSSEPVVELKAREMRIWIPERCLAELDEQIIVRGPRGFAVGAMTDSLRAQATQFIE